MKVLNLALHPIIVLIQDFDYFNNPRFREKFDGSCLKSYKVKAPNKIINFIYYLCNKIMATH